MEVSRKFKGIWIPKEIWLDTDLPMMAKILWAELNSLHDNENGGCYASNEYLTNFLQITERRIQQLLKILKEKELIESIKSDGRIRKILLKNGGSFRVCPEKNFAPDPKKISPIPLEPYIQEEGIVENINNIRCNTKSQNSVSSSLDASRLVLFFISQIQKLDPKFKPTESQEKKWAQEIEKMHRVDDRSWKDIEEIIVYATTNDFWKGNVLSGKKLREKSTTFWTQLKKNPKDSRAYIGGKRLEEYDNLF